MERDLRKTGRYRVADRRVHSETAMPYRGAYTKRLLEAPRLLLEDKVLS